VITFYYMDKHACLCIVSSISTVNENVAMNNILKE
jgi:hypothetical protein